jgi:chromosome segregation ATPase
MGMLEHVKVLESKVDKEIELAKRLMEENAQLREKTHWYQQQIDDRDALIQAYKEEQHAIESGILSALNRLSQFEDAVEKKTRQADSDGSLLEEETQVKPTAPAEPDGGGETASELETPAEQD